MAIKKISPLQLLEIQIQFYILPPQVFEQSLFLFCVNMYGSGTWKVTWCSWHRCRQCCHRSKPCPRRPPCKFGPNRPFYKSKVFDNSINIFYLGKLPLGPVRWCCRSRASWSLPRSQKSWGEQGGHRRCLCRWREWPKKIPCEWFPFDFHNYQAPCGRYQPVSIQLTPFYFHTEILPPF